MSETADETVCVELSRSQATGLVGILQQEKKRLRSRENHAAVEELGDIQELLIDGCNREDGGA